MLTAGSSKSVEPSQRVEEFVRAATEVAASVERVPRTAESIRDAVANATRECRTVVVAEAEVIPSDLWTELRTLPGVLESPNDEQLATADAGVTEAFAGIASTGSVCIAVGASMAPAASLLMPLHVVILPAERLLQRPRELFAREATVSPVASRNFVFTTGPSATADMGPLVRGVHGPHRLHIVVVDP